MNLYFCIALAWLVAQVTQSRAFEKSIENLSEPSYLGKFGGSKVSIKISVALGAGYEPSQIYQKKLSLMAFTEKSERSCHDRKSAVIDTDVYLPAYGAWSQDQLFHQNFPTVCYFYIDDCRHELKQNNLVMAKLEITDDINQHISYENLAFGRSCLVLAGFYCALILFITLEIWKEKRDLAPLIILMVVTVGYVLSIVFELLHASIYEINGNSFKFLLVFSEIFESFAWASMFGVIVLVNAQKFNTKDFAIEESEFYWYAFFMFVKAFFGILNVVLSGPMERFADFERVDGRISSLAVVWHLWVVFRYNWRAKTKNFARADPKFQKVRLLAVFFVVKDLLAVWLMRFFPIHGQETLAFITENAFKILTLCYFLLNFCSLELICFLPIKSHRF